MKLTLVCGNSSVEITPPHVLNNTKDKDFLKIGPRFKVYKLSTFNVSYAHCPIDMVKIVPV